MYVLVPVVVIFDTFPTLVKYYMTKKEVIKWVVKCVSKSIINSVNLFQIIQFPFIISHKGHVNFQTNRMVFGSMTTYAP